MVKYTQSIFSNYFIKVTLKSECKKSWAFQLSRLIGPLTYSKK
jgi:hypothetical protein